MSETFNNIMDVRWVGRHACLEHRSPSDVSELMCNFVSGSVGDVFTGVVAVFDAKQVWAEALVQTYAGIFYKAGAALLSLKEKIGRLPVRKKERPLAEALGEADCHCRVFSCCAAELLQRSGKNGASVRPSVDVDITRDSVGVAGPIARWSSSFAVTNRANGTFFSTGQRCTESSRLIVTMGGHDEVVERMAAAIEAQHIGHALYKAATIGQVVDEQQLASRFMYVDMGYADDVELIGGGRLNRKTKDFFQAPALFMNASNDCRTSREEIFSPCAGVIKSHDFESAIYVANDAEFGLSSRICAASSKHAADCKRLSEVGIMIVRLRTARVDYQVAFWGWNTTSNEPCERGDARSDFVR